MTDGIISSPKPKRSQACRIRPALGATLLYAVLVSACATDTPGDSAALESGEQTRLELARGSEMQGQHAKAGEMYESLYTGTPTDLPLLISAARNYRYAGGAQHALGLLERAGTPGADHPLAPDYWLELAKTQLSSGFVDSALRSLARAESGAPQAWPHAWDILSVRGIALDLMESYQDAQVAYEKSLALNPRNPVVMNNYAMSLAQTGDLSKAESMLNKAARIARDSVQIRQNLALISALRGNLTEAEALARMDLGDKMVQNNLTFFHRIQSDIEQRKSSK